MADFKYFTLKELCSSDVAEKKKIDNFPSFTVVEHLNELTEKILEPLRAAWGSSIIVNSGYRCDALNRANFDVCGVFGDYGFGEPQENCERWYIVSRTRKTGDWYLCADKENGKNDEYIS